MYFTHHDAIQKTEVIQSQYDLYILFVKNELAIEERECYVASECEAMIMQEKCRLRTLDKI